MSESARRASEIEGLRRLVENAHSVQAETEAEVAEAEPAAKRPKPNEIKPDAEVSEPPVAVARTFASPARSAPPEKAVVTTVRAPETVVQAKIKPLVEKTIERPVIVEGTAEAPVMSVEEAQAQVTIETEVNIESPVVDEVLEEAIEPETALLLSQEELVEEIPELAMFYVEGEAAESAEFDGELPLATRLELSLFNEESETIEVAADTSEPPEILFSLPEEAADLTELLRKLEPEQVETVQPVISNITQLVEQIQQLPESEEAETEKQVMEQVLEQWCGRLFEQLNIESDAETVRQFVKLLMEQPIEKSGEEPFSPLLMPDKGTREYKPTDGLGALSRLARDLKQKLHLPLWLGRYTLRVAVA